MKRLIHQQKLEQEAASREEQESKKREQEILAYLKP